MAIVLAVRARFIVDGRGSTRVKLVEELDGCELRRSSGESPFWDEPGAAPLLLADPVCEVSSAWADTVDLKNVI